MSRREASQYPLVESRLLPRLSLNSLLGLMTLAAVIASLARLAGQGGALALAALALVAFVGGCFLAFAGLFLVARLAALVVHRSPRGREAHVGSPFAVDQLPPQMLPPREPRL